MAGIYWFRPIGWDERDYTHDDVAAVCEACEDETCQGECEPLNEDRLIDQVMEDTLSPPIEK